MTIYLAATVIALVGVSIVWLTYTLTMVWKTRYSARMRERVRGL